MTIGTRQAIASIIALLFCAICLLPSMALAETAPGCNSVAFSQVPNNQSYFLGRRFTGGCGNSPLTINLWQMNFSNGQINSIRDLITLPVAIGPNTITSAYDPSVFIWNNETWVAFECAGSGPNLNGPASSCMAPLVGLDHLDTSRMSIVVSGQAPTNNNSNGYSASVPKVFAYSGTPYLYWTVTHFVNGANGQIPTDTTVRGGALALDGASSSRFWLTGSGQYISSTLGSNTVEVMSHDTSDATLNEIADGFDVISYNGRLLMTVGVGGLGCSSPSSPTYACYRMQIRTSSSPLAVDGYDGTAVTSLNLPFNPHEYSRFFINGNGGYSILGQFLNPTLNGSAPASQVLSYGIQQFPVDPANFTYGSPSYTPQANPSTPGAELPSTFLVFQQFMPSCDRNNPYPNPGSGDCRAAASRFCVSQGYGAGGVVVENSADNNTVGCLTTSHALRQEIDASTLSGINGNCTNANLGSDSCMTAINTYCRSLGYNGGFGPLEHSGTLLQIACPDNQIGQTLATTFTALSQQVADCTSTSWTGSAACMAAANRICRNQGFATSYGITDHYYDAANIGCWRSNT